MTTPAVVGRMLLIAVVMGTVAAAFAYCAGWLTPQRLTPVKLVAALAPPGGAALGHRRNHVTGICFTGTFAANGVGRALTAAPMFRMGQYPVIGRFNVGTADVRTPDVTVRVRGMGLQIAASDGQLWRMALINPPFFAVSTPTAFYALLAASASADPGAMPAFAAAHPEIAHFGAWAKRAPWTGSYAEETYNSLDSFVFTNGSGTTQTVRWSLQPETMPVAVAPEELAKRGAGFLEQDIARRIHDGPAKWTMWITVADTADPTADPSQAWPAGRRSLEVGTLTVREVEPEVDGPCRDINFDPTVLPSGISLSDDPFPAARSAAYRRSYDLREAEVRDYPHIARESAP